MGYKLSASQNLKEEYFFVHDETRELFITSRVGQQSLDLAAFNGVRAGSCR
jgi:hypothetical protein